jgi:cyanophycinase
MLDSKQFINLISTKYSLVQNNKDLRIDKIGSNNINHKSPQKLYFLMGGGIDNDQAFVEYLKALDGGDLLVLSGSEDPIDYNDYFIDLARKNSIILNSSSTALIHSRTGAEEPKLTKLINESEAIFFSGGDQWKYIDRIKNTSAHLAILRKLQSGVPFGGTSAGLAILGDKIFTAKNGSVSSDEVLPNPLSPLINLSNSMFNFENLKNIITDSHFVTRDRMGRLIAFVANADYYSKSFSLRGLGIDEETVLVVNPQGDAHTIGKGAIYLLTPTEAPMLNETHFFWDNIAVNRWLSGSSFSFNQLPAPDYFYKIENAKIISTQKNGEIY